METMIITFIGFSLMIILMSVGVIFSNRRIQGSCGGLGKIMGDDCDFCEKKQRGECPSAKKEKEL